MKRVGFKQKHFVSLLFLLILLLTACGETIPQGTVVMPTSVVTKNMTFQVPASYGVEQVPVYNENRIKKTEIAIVGDIMVHHRQLRKAYDPTNESFDFNKSFDYIRSYLIEQDFTIGNLETTFGGYGGSVIKNDETFFRGYSGYPCFNTPDSLAQALKEVGFDLVSTGNNHSLDSGVSGLLRTLDVLDDSGIAYVGTQRNLPHEPYVMQSVNDLEIAFINYTYGSNGFTLKPDKAHHLNTLNMYEAEKQESLLMDVKKADASGADLVIVMMHWGNEYQYKPEERFQVPLAQAIAEAGADIIIGGHPHVLQPIDSQYEKTNGEKAFIAYSMGNFLSSQINLKNYGGAFTDMGLILTLELTQIDNKKPVITGFYLLPTFMQNGTDAMRILPVFEDENQSELPTLSAYDQQRMDAIRGFGIKLLVGETGHQIGEWTEKGYFLSN